jgi:aminopeptidase-like protein
MLWVLNMSDGSHSLLDIADRSGLDFGLIKNAADALLEKELLEEFTETEHLSLRRF